MSCITAGNTRCTKRGIINVGASQSLLKYWKPISARRAKKLNPYIWERQAEYNLQEGGANVQRDMQFFTCTALEKGVGCTIRDQDDHPQVCKTFQSDDSYSATCGFDINIIARG